jgi:glutaredoxin
MGVQPSNECGFVAARRDSAALLVLVLLASASATMAQDASHSGANHRKRDNASAKAPQVEVLTPSPVGGEAYARARARVQVVVYTTSWCSACNEARSYFRKHDVKFVEYDIERDAPARQRYLAINPSGSVPTIAVDGHVMLGFSAALFEKLMDRAARERAAHGEGSGPKTFEVRWDKSAS